MSNQEEGPSIGLPQLAACLFIGFLVYRYFSAPSTPTPASSTTTSRPSPAQLRRLQEQAVIIQGVVPQVSTNAAIWELLKNGGSVAECVNKALAEGNLPEPPTPIVDTPPPAPAPARRPAGATSSSKTTTYPDLITRYNLASRLNETVDESAESGDASGVDKKGKGPAWSQNKAERAALLQKRRDEMILAARRKLEEKEAKGKGKEVAA